MKQRCEVVIDMILRNIPLSALLPSIEGISTSDWSTSNHTMVPSQTKVRLSKRRRDVAPTQPTSPVALPNSTEQQPLPTLHMAEKDGGQFLEIMRGRKGDTLEFKELASFMRKVGYKMIECRGGRSKCRFVLKASNGSHRDTYVP